MESSTVIAISGVDHINIETRDVQTSVEFYSNFFGLRSGWRPAFDVSGAWLYAGQKAVIHLVERPDAPLALERPINHFAFQARGLKAFEKMLEEHGVKYSKSLVPGTEIVQILVRDPNNVGVECSFENAEL